jgi:putative endonuclease
MEKIYSYFVYILTNKDNNVFYTGVTNNLLLRITQHKLKINEGFTKKYNTWKLVYFEHYPNVNFAINREKRLKKWNREWKLRVIRKMNPKMKDLIYDYLDDSEIKELKDLLNSKVVETPA